jgi:hypothetical protein
MYDEALLAKIRDYISRNRASFTLDALRRKLIEEGVPADAIDVAIAQLYPDPYRGPSPVAQPGTNRSWTVGRVVLTMLGITILNLVVGAASIWAGIALDSGIPFLAGCGGLLVAEIAGAIYFARRNGSLSIGLVLGIVLSPVAAVAILFGLCILVLSNYN